MPLIINVLGCRLRKNLAPNNLAIAPFRCNFAVTINRNFTLIFIYYETTIFCVCRSGRNGGYKL